MDFGILSKYDDILASYFVDSLYLWFKTIRMNSDFQTIPISQSDIVEIIRKQIHCKPYSDGIKAATEIILNIPFFENYVRNLPSKQLFEFKSHLKLYLYLYLPNAGFEISSTARYTGTMEACIVATKDWKAGEHVKFCVGSIAELSEEDDLKLKHEGRDFSVLYSFKKNCSCLFLGPARFMNHDCNANCSFILLGNSCVTFKVEKDITCGEEMTVFYGEHYFGEDNCECRCLSCEKSQKGSFQIETDESNQQSPNSHSLENSFLENDANSIRRSGRIRKDVSYKDFFLPSPTKKSKQLAIHQENEQMNEMEIDETKKNSVNLLSDITNQLAKISIQPNKKAVTHRINPDQIDYSTMDDVQAFQAWVDTQSDLSDDDTNEPLNEAKCCSQAKEFEQVKLTKDCWLCVRCYRHYMIFGFQWPHRREQRYHWKAKSSKLVLGASENTNTEIVTPTKLKKPRKPRQKKTLTIPNQQATTPALINEPKPIDQQVDTIVGEDEPKPINQQEDGITRGDEHKSIDQQKDGVVGNVIKPTDERLENIVEKIIDCYKGKDSLLELIKEPESNEKENETSQQKENIAEKVKKPRQNRKKRATHPTEVILNQEMNQTIVNQDIKKNSTVEKTIKPKPNKKEETKPKQKRIKGSKQQQIENRTIEESNVEKLPSEEIIEVTDNLELVSEKNKRKSDEPETNASLHKRSKVKKTTGPNISILFEPVITSTEPIYPNEQEHVHIQRELSKLGAPQLYNQEIESILKGSPGIRTRRMRTEPAYEPLNEWLLVHFYDYDEPNKYEINPFSRAQSDESYVDIMTIDSTVKTKEETPLQEEIDIEGLCIKEEEEEEKEKDNKSDTSEYRQEKNESESESDHETAKCCNSSELKRLQQGQEETSVISWDVNSIPLMTNKSIPGEQMIEEQILAKTYSQLDEQVFEEQQQQQQEQEVAYTQIMRHYEPNIVIKKNLVQCD